MGYGLFEYGGGLIWFKFLIGEVKWFKYDFLDLNSLLDNRVSVFLEDEEGKIWVGIY